MTAISMFCQNHIYIYTYIHGRAFFFFFLPFLSGVPVPSSSQYHTSHGNAIFFLRGRGASSLRPATRHDVEQLTTLLFLFVLLFVSFSRNVESLPDVKTSWDNLMWNLEFDDDDQESEELVNSARQAVTAALVEVL